MKITLVNRAAAASFLSLSLAVSALADDKSTAPAPSAEERGSARHLLSAGKDAFRAGRFDDAAKLFGEAFAKDSSLDAALFNQAYALRRGERYAEAREVYTRYLERNPDDLDTQYALARTAQLLGDKEDARRWYSAYVEKETRTERARYVEHAKAQIALLGPAPKAPVIAEKPPEKAVETPAPEPAVVVVPAVTPVTAQPKASVPYDGAARFAEGMRLYQQKLYREAAVVFLEVYDNDTKRTKALYRHALALRQAGDLDAARGAYERFLSAEPADPDGVFGLAETERAAGKSERAIGLYERYLEVEKRPSEESWRARARGYIAVLRASLTAPSSASPAVVKPTPAEAPPAEAPPAEAPAGPVEVAVAAPPSIFRGPADLHRPLLARGAAVESLVERAQQDLDAGRHAEALEGFSLALSHAPTHALALEGRQAALDAGNAAAGPKAAADDVDSLLDAGEDKLLKKDSEGALKAFQRAHAVSPSSARPHWGLARAYEQAGLQSAAKHHYRLYRESTAADRDAKKADEAWWKIESL